MIYFYLPLAIGMIGSLLTFIRPRYFLTALGLAGFYTLFFKVLGIGGTGLLIMFLLFWISLWVGFLLYGHSEDIGEAT